MSGLELIDQANECLPDLKIIVLTGYDRFDYARECIRMKVEDLYLKPISFERKQFMQIVILLPGEGTDSGEKKDEFWWMSVRELCISLVDGREYGITFQDDEKIAIAFFHHGYANEIYDIIHEMTSIMKDEFTSIPQIVLGSIVEGFEQLYISYNDAQILMEKRTKKYFGIDSIREYRKKKHSLSGSVYGIKKFNMCKCGKFRVCYAYI